MILILSIFLIISVVINVFLFKNYIENSGILDSIKNQFQSRELEFQLKESHYKESIQSLKDGYEKQITQVKETYNNFANKVVSEFEQKAVNSAKVAAKDIAKELEERYKEKSEETKKDSESYFKQITEKMYEDLNKISNVSSRNREIMENIDKDQRKIIEAFSSGIDSGVFCEQLLEQKLKNFGFIAGQDYVLQYSTVDGKRPDAIVFLPNNQYLVIDCKSSKYFIKEAGISDEEYFLNISTSVAKHIKDISSKAYYESVKKDINSAIGRSSDNPMCYTVMYLPNDKIYYDLISKDPSIGRSAIDNKIIIAGPVSFEAILHNSKSAISIDLLSRNFEKEKDAIKSLTEGIIDACKMASDIGDGIQKTISAYEKFIKTADPDGKFVRKLSNASNILGIEQKGLDKIQKIKYFGVIPENKDNSEE